MGQPTDREIEYFDGERYDPHVEVHADRWATCRERDVLDRVRSDDDARERDVDRPPPGWARTGGGRR